MYKIIGGDRKEYGPATADELRQWIAEGRLNGQSLVQAEGSGEWKPLAMFPEFADALAGQVVHPPVPITPAAAAPEAWAAQTPAGQPTLQVGHCLSRSWDLLSANFGLFFGAALLVWVLDLICQFIPLIGEFVYWAADGVLGGGLYLVFLSRIRGQPAGVGDVFAGFNRNAAQLMLAGFLTAFLTRIGLMCCLILPGLYLLIAWTFSVPLVADKRLEFWSAMELSRKVVTRVWFQALGLVVLAFLPVIITGVFVQVKISLAMIPLMQEVFSSSQPDFKHLIESMFQVARTTFPLTMLLKFVFLLNLPFASGALMYAYEDLFGPRSTPTT